MYFFVIWLFNCFSPYLSTCPKLGTCCWRVVVCWCGSISTLWLGLRVQLVSFAPIPHHLIFSYTSSALKFWTLSVTDEGYSWRPLWTLEIDYVLVSFIFILLKVISEIHSSVVLAIFVRFVRSYSLYFCWYCHVFEFCNAKLWFTTEQGPFWLASKHKLLIVFKGFDFEGNIKYQKSVKAILIRFC